MTYIIGNAWCDENGKASGGKPGDQKQKKVDDYSGEVRQQDFYESAKGWYVFRPISAKHATDMAKKMIIACNNVHIGYSQSDRYGIIKNGIETKVNTNCDCSSLVRECIKEATSVDPGDFRTATQVKALEKTNLFEQKFEYKTGDKLYTGDVIVTKVSGHTAILTHALERTGLNPEKETNPYPEPTKNVTSKANAIEKNVKTYISKGDEVKWVQWYLCEAGYAAQIKAAGGIDGICGSTTVKCIKWFQNRYNLEVDGICGKNTRTKMKELF